MAPASGRVTMNPPLYELLLRVAVAAMATGTFVAIAYAARKPGGYGPVPLLKFLGFTVLLNAVWRWALVLLGVVDDVGIWGWTLAWVQPLNAVFLFALYFALFLMGVYHIRRGRQRR